MTESILDILKKTNAIITDSHIVYTSGMHGSMYFNKDAIYPHTRYSSLVGELFADRCREYPIDVVVGPALGGIILSQWTAYSLSKLLEKEILGVYTEKDSDSNQVFRRGYDKLIQGKNVLILEDIVNTGGSVMKVVTSVKNAGGKISCVGVMVNRKPKEFTKATVGHNFFSLIDIPSEAYDADNCPLCAKEIPINTSVGHGKMFLQSKQT